MKRKFTLLIILILTVGIYIIGCVKSNISDNLDQNAENTVNLTELSQSEKEIYDKFCESYDENLLKESNPQNIMKMFIVASMNKDHETQSHLYTTNPKYITASNDEILVSTVEPFPYDQSIFDKVYDLTIEINRTDVSHAYITWKSKNGYADENGNTFVYGFSLQKDEDIWKVSINPMN